MGERAGFEYTAEQVAEAIGSVVTGATIRNWYHGGRLPTAYVWRSPTGRLWFKHKVIAWVLAEGMLPEPPAEPKPRPRVRPVRWDRAS